MEMKAVILILCVATVAIAGEGNRKTCLEEPDPGMCRAYIESYYYDYKSRSCKEFIYGGCDGNGNRYASEEECMTHCGDVVVFDSEDDDDACNEPREPGGCLAFFKRFYFDKEAQECRRFVYGGCGGNRNNFFTKAECEERCLKRAAPRSFCLQEKVSGPCRAHFPRYFFNKESGECELFVYGGCNGNENNFLTKEECEDLCKE